MIQYGYKKLQEKKFSLRYDTRLKKYITPRLNVGRFV
jgi:hypothetical protein